MNIDIDLAHKILDSLPKDKSPLSLGQILELDNLKRHISLKDNIKEYLTYLREEELINRGPFGYKINESGLDLLAPDDETPDEYIIRKIKENHGIYNLNMLNGRRFRNNEHKSAMIQALENKGWIELVKNASPNSYFLTSKYERDKVLFYKPLVLRKLFEQQQKIIGWDEVNKALGIKDSLSNPIKNLLLHEGFINIHKTTKQGDIVEITPKVTAFFYEEIPHQGSGQINSGSAQIIGGESINIVMNHKVSENEKPKMERHYSLDTIQWIVGIAISAIAGSFFLGKEIGATKYEQIKIDLSEENRILKQRVIDDSIRKKENSELKLAVDSLRKIKAFYESGIKTQ